MNVKRSWKEKVNISLRLKFFVLQENISRDSPANVVHECLPHLIYSFSKKEMFRYCFISVVTRLRFKRNCFVVFLLLLGFCFVFCLFVCLFL